jgi:hypothetical protein
MAKTLRPVDSWAFRDLLLALFGQQDEAALEGDWKGGG